MKKFILIYLAIFLTHNISAQILYDNGPIDDPNNNFTLEGRSWNHNNLTYFFQNGTDDIVGDAERNAVEQAMTIWENSSEITFTEVSNLFSADIVIRWATGDHGDGSNFDGTSGVLAHAFFPPPNSGSLAGDMHFDDAETWSTDIQTNSLQPIDLVTVALHELGHSLGLRHSDVVGAIMYPYYSGSQRFLATDDILGISRLYPKDRSIAGSSYICQSNSYVYTISDITQNDIVTWSTSSNLQIINSNNSNITVSTPDNSGSGWITANINGIEVTKQIWIGIPSYSTVSGDNSPMVGEYKTYSVPAGSDVNSYNWYFDVGNGVTGTNVDGWEILSYGYQNKSINVRVGNPGSTVVVCEVANSCGSRTRYTYVNVRSQSDPCGELRLSSNPMKSGSSTNKLIWVEDPCDPPYDDPNGNKTANSKKTVEVFNQYGEKVYSQSQTENEFYVNNLKKGFYIVRSHTINGKIMTKKLIIE